MAKLSKIRLSAEAQTKGRWVEWEHGISFLVARLNTPVYQERMRELSQPNLEAIRAGDVTALHDLTVQTVAECVLLGWKNLDDDDDKAIPYSKEKSLEILSDATLSDIWSFVLLTANRREVFLVEESAKNSETASNGPLNGESTKQSSEEVTPPF